MLYVYRTWPQDGFVGWTLDEFVKLAVHVRQDSIVVDVDDNLLCQFQEAWRKGKAMARQLKWDGDIRPGYPLISMLPEENDRVSLVIVWKQEHAGTSFVISERSLPWLEEQQCGHLVSA
jgi:hypothetical protein